MGKTSGNGGPGKRPSSTEPSISFSQEEIASFFPVLEAITWLQNAKLREIAQFGELDVETVEGVLKNCMAIGIVQATEAEGYALAAPYPYNGGQKRKQAMMREALVRMPLTESIRQFTMLGDSIDDALRKAATVNGLTSYTCQTLEPLTKWARQLKVFLPDLLPEDLVAEGAAAKRERHDNGDSEVVVFLCYPLEERVFARRLAGDLAREDVIVWLDERRDGLGGMRQGLAESDYFLAVLSEDEAGSKCMKKLLSEALVKEMEKQEVKVLRLSRCRCEAPIKDKDSFDFSAYENGLAELLTTIRNGNQAGTTLSSAGSPCQ